MSIGCYLHVLLAFQPFQAFPLTSGARFALPHHLNGSDCQSQASHSVFNFVSEYSHPWVFKSRFLSLENNIVFINVIIVSRNY